MGERIGDDNGEEAAGQIRQDSVELQLWLCDPCTLGGCPDPLCGSVRSKMFSEEYIFTIFSVGIYTDGTKLGSHCWRLGAIEFGALPQFVVIPLFATANSH